MVTKCPAVLHKLLHLTCMCVCFIPVNYSISSAVHSHLEQKFHHFLHLLKLIHLFTMQLVCPGSDAIVRDTCTKTCTATCCTTTCCTVTSTVTCTLTCTSSYQTVGSCWTSCLSTHHIGSSWAGFLMTSLLVKFSLLTGHGPFGSLPVLVFLSFLSVLELWVGSLDIVGSSSSGNCS